MRVFVAGATGAVGRRLIPALLAAGHDVTGSTRTESKAAELRAAGADASIMDGLDRDSVLAALTGARPEVVIHQMSELTNASSLKKFDDEFERTNILRTRGLDYLLEAAREAGAKRFVAQSYTGWPNPRSGSLIKTEEDGLDPDPAPSTVKTLRAIEYLESKVSTASDVDGVVLRYGGFYGPGTGWATDGSLVKAVRKRQLPIGGGGEGVMSFIHIDDAASATTASVVRGSPGLYNIVDDEPAPEREWLPFLAEAIGAKPPRKLPVWLVKPMLGQHGVNIMTASRGSSNTKAKRELGWELTYPSWRQGFRSGL